MHKFLTALIFLLVAPGVSAYQGYDECGEFEAALIEAQFALELDTPFEKKSVSHGIRVTFGDDAEAFEYPYISFVHPDFFEDDDDKTAYEKQYEIYEERVLSINGTDVSSITKEEFFSQFDAQEIDLAIDSIEGTLQITSKKREFVSSPIYISPVLTELRDINTKRSSFGVVVDERATVIDTRVDRLAREIYERSRSNISVPYKRLNGFNCRLSDDFLAAIDYSIPEIEPRSFAYEENYQRSRSVTFTFTDLNCGVSDEVCLGNTTYLAEFYDIDGQELSSFEIHESYAGTFFDSFSLRKFPFDDHTLKAVFYTDHSRAPYFYELIKDPDAIIRAGVASRNYDSENSGWDFTDYNFWESAEYDAALNVWLPDVYMAINIERQSSYYLLKIAMPILLVLLMCWSILFINVNQFESRVTIGIVCMLSLIAYNFVIDADLPKLGYVTFMDFFILLAYLFAGTIILASIAERYFFDNDRFKYRSIRFNQGVVWVVPIVFFTSLTIGGLYFLNL